MDAHSPTRRSNNAPRTTSLCRESVHSPRRCSRTRECQACGSPSPGRAAADRIMGTALVAHSERGDRGHIRTGAVAGDSKPHWVGAELGGMRRDPSRRMQTIVDAGWEFVLGREAIIDRSDDAPCTGAKIAAHPVVSFEATQHETAAVKEHQQWEWTHAMRRVNSDAQRSARAVDGSLAN